MFCCQFFFILSLNILVTVSRWIAKKFPSSLPQEVPEMWTQVASLPDFWSQFVSRKNFWVKIIFCHIFHKRGPPVFYCICIKTWVQKNPYKNHLWTFSTTLQFYGARLLELVAIYLGSFSLPSYFSVSEISSVFVQPFLDTILWKKNWNFC